VSAAAPDRSTRSPEFRRFWIGQSISFLGSEVSLLALPLIAVVTLRADAGQMGILTALGLAPFLLIGLQAGVWVDRMQRRRILIWSDLATAALLLTIPAAAIAGVLRIEQMYVLALLIGAIEVVSSVAHQSFVPSLVQRSELAAANARLEGSNSAATIVGPSVAGVLVQVLTAPIAVLVDAVSFVVSALVLRTVRVEEPKPMPAQERAGMRTQAAEGLRHVLRHPLLRPVFSCGATHNFFRRMIDALFVLFAVTELGLDPVALGVVFAAGGPGALLGAAIAVPLARRIGLGRTIVWMQVLTGISCFAAPLAGGPTWLTVGILAAGQFLLGVARPVFNINQLSLRQAITPDRLQGRVNATMRFIMWGVTPFGALMGGLLGSTIGLRTTLLIAAGGVLLAFVWVAASPVRRLESVPAAAGAS
jgi:MFS family permease